MEMVERGAFFCPFYKLNPLKEVAEKIYKVEHLPSFTGITHKDKHLINRARYNLFSLLIPIHDRETALKEFVAVSSEWLRLTDIYQAEPLEKFLVRYLSFKNNENYLREYTR